ncbi:MAG: TusE/DsrC/DsvC family sulfur relay protein [Deltaproteobacteria bacterium]|nr:TusE/DsrC/DsvC family sulfur relay protein [Deltaproteobacteria bacterium]
MAGKLFELNDQLENTLNRLPDDEIQIPEVKYALIDIELKARSIVNQIDKLYLNPDYIDIAPERVKSNAQIIVYAAKEYIKPSSSCSRPGETEERALSSVIIIGPRIVFDEDGFICNFDNWDEEVAEALADKEGIEKLTEEHWCRIPQ